MNMLRYGILALGFFLLMNSAIQAQEMSISSQSFKEGERLSKRQEFSGFGCSGNNLSPQLSWGNIPKEAKSLALSIYDPDAPTGSGWWHWTIFNLPINMSSLAEGVSGDPQKLPAGVVQGRTDYGSSRFGGACPPEGDKPHRYIVTLFALDVEKIELDKEASGALVGYFLHKHAIKKVSLTGLYSR